MPAVETRTRLGPYVHAKIGDGWEDRRAMIVRLPVHCRRCKSRVEAGGTVLMVNGGHDYICRNCRLHHIRGLGACPRCDRLRMTGPKCRACNGAGYSAREG
jgi:predicted ATP-dependent serine protease